MDICLEDYRALRPRPGKPASLSSGANMPYATAGSVDDAWHFLQQLDQLQLKQQEHLSKLPQQQLHGNHQQRQLEHPLEINAAQDTQQYVAGLLGANSTSLFQHGGLLIPAISASCTGRVLRLPADPSASTCHPAGTNAAQIPVILYQLEQQQEQVDMLQEKVTATETAAATYHWGLLNRGSATSPFANVAALVTSPQHRQQQHHVPLQSSLCHPASFREPSTDTSAVNATDTKCGLLTKSFISTAEVTQREAQLHAGMLLASSLTIGGDCHEQAAAWSEVDVGPVPPELLVPQCASRRGDSRRSSHEPAIPRKGSAEVDMAVPVVPDLTTAPSRLVLQQLGQQEQLVGFLDTDGYLQELTKAQMDHQNQLQQQQHGGLGRGSAFPSAFLSSSTTPFAAQGGDMLPKGACYREDQKQHPGIPEENHKGILRRSTWGCGEFTGAGMCTVAAVHERGGPERTTARAGQTMQQQQQHWARLPRKAPARYASCPCPMPGSSWSQEPRATPRNDSAAGASSAAHKGVVAKGGSGSSSSRGGALTRRGDKMMGQVSSSAAAGGCSQRMGRPKWAGQFWNPLAEAVKSGQLANKGTGVFLPAGMAAALAAAEVSDAGGSARTTAGGPEATSE